MKLNYSMMKALRGRHGLDENDESMDSEILAMNPPEIVQECSAWHLGSRDWAVVFAEWCICAGCKPEDILNI